MAEKTTAESFILRIYRVDTKDPNRLAGLVERMDGSGERESFTDLEGLADILNRSVAKPQKSRKKVSGKQGTVNGRQ